MDLIVALTEGLVADIAKGSDLRLLGTYVESPLCWAISAGANSSIQTLEDLKGKKWGISRLTSGSHLMVFVLANQRGWNPETDLSFEVKGDFQNLRNSVNDGSTAAFMWETFTTKPFHDSGEIRRIGDIMTPWPCFMIAATKATIDAKAQAIQATLAAVREACKIFHSEEDTMPGIVAERYGLKLEDARKWYAGVKISATKAISEAALERTISTLADVKVLPSKDVRLQSLYDPKLVELQVDIKRMKLYNKPELVARTYNELRAAGLSRGPLDFKDLIPVDQQHHYHGTEALDVCIQKTHLNSNSNVISLGSGLGGPARYIAGTLGCQVLAVDIQDDLNATASELTTRCGLNSKVHHIASDFLQIASHLRGGFYDAIVSWLTVLHIPDRENLFRLSYEVLKPGGYFYAEDFFERGKLTAEEKRTLQEDVFCTYLPSLDKYKADLEKAGFTLVSVEDVTDDWTNYTRERVEKFDQNKAEFVRIHGEDIWTRLRYFYNQVRELYAAGNLGGVRIVAQKGAVVAPSITPPHVRSTAVELNW